MHVMVSLCHMLTFHAHSTQSGVLVVLAIVPMLISRDLAVVARYSRNSIVMMLFLSGTMMALAGTALWQHKAAEIHLLPVLKGSVFRAGAKLAASVLSVLSVSFLAFTCQVRGCPGLCCWEWLGRTVGREMRWCATAFFSGTPNGAGMEAHFVLHAHLPSPCLQFNLLPVVRLQGRLGTVHIWGSVSQGYGEVGTVSRLRSWLCASMSGDRDHC